MSIKGIYYDFNEKTEKIKGNRNYNPTNNQEQQVSNNQQDIEET